MAAPERVRYAPLCAGRLNAGAHRGAAEHDVGEVGVTLTGATEVLEGAPPDAEP